MLLLLAMLGTVIQDVATDGSFEVTQTAAAVAGPAGTVEVRSIQEAMVGQASAESPATHSFFNENETHNRLIDEKSLQVVTPPLTNPGDRKWRHFTTHQRTQSQFSR